jgi:hypothetical protein
MTHTTLARGNTSTPIEEASPRLKGRIAGAFCLMNYEKQGKKPEAMSNYAASLKINPNQKDVEAAMKRVP